MLHASRDGVLKTIARRKPDSFNMDFAGKRGISNKWREKWRCLPGSRDDLLEGDDSLGDLFYHVHSAPLQTHHLARVCVPLKNNPLANKVISLSILLFLFF